MKGKKTTSSCGCVLQTFATGGVIQNLSNFVRNCEPHYLCTCVGLFGYFVDDKIERKKEGMVSVGFALKQIIILI